MFTVYLFHQGAANNQYYSLHLRPPRVTTREVRDEKTGEPAPLFETPDPFIFNFCLYGMERRLGLKVPLGEVRKMTFTLEALE